MTDFLGVEVCLLDPSNLDLAFDVDAMDEVKDELLFEDGLIFILFNGPGSPPPSDFRFRDVLEVLGGMVTESKTSRFTVVLDLACLVAFEATGFLLSDMGVGGA